MKSESTKIRTRLLATALASSLLGTAPTARALDAYAVDQYFNEYIALSGTGQFVDVNGASFAQTFIPQRENVAYVSIFVAGAFQGIPPSGEYRVQLREGSFDGSVLGLSEPPSSFVVGAEGARMILPFITPVGVLPGGTYAFTVQHPNGTDKLRLFQPGGYAPGAARVSGVVNGSDLWFEEGPAALLVGSGATLPPTQPNGTVRVTTRTVSTDLATAQVWQTNVSGSARGGLVVEGAEQKNHIAGVFVDPATFTARVPFTIDFDDNGVAGAQSQRCTIRTHDLVDFFNSTAAPLNITVNLRFEGECDIPAGGTAAITFFCSDGPTSDSKLVNLTAGDDQMVDQTSTITLAIAPGASSRQIISNLNFLASEGTYCDAEDTLTLSYVLPAGVAMTGSLMGVPEPGAAMLALLGMGGIAIRRRRRG
jgi:hypothetical protein